MVHKFSLGIDQATITIVVLMVVFTVIYLLLNLGSFKREEKEKQPKAQKIRTFFMKLLRIKPKIDYDAPLPVTPGKSYNYSFTARLTLAPDQSLGRYNALKNEILSYANVTSSLTWKEETFLYNGKIVLKLRIHGQTMRLYLTLSSTDLAEHDFVFVDVSHFKEHENTNIYYRIKNEKTLEEAFALVHLCFKKLDIVRGFDLALNDDYRLMRQTRSDLLAQDLIKVVDAPNVESGEDDGEEVED